MRRSNRLVVAALGVVALAATACGGSGSGQAASDGPLTVDGVQIADQQLWSAAQKEGTLTLYTAVGEERANAVADVFHKQTGLNVDVIRLAGGRLVERVLSEQGAHRLSADVIMQSDLVLAQQEHKAGVFQSYCPPGLAKVDPQLKPANCEFYGAQTPIYAIGTNTQLVPADQAPKTWKDLLDPKWKGGKLGLAHIGAGGSTWARDLFLRQKYGIEYWRQLAAQKPFITGGAASVVQQMARGEIQVGMVLPGDLSVAAGQGAPLALQVPADGVPSYAHWTGLTAAAAHPNAAKVFLNWYLSLPGQTAVAQKGGDYPVIPGAPGPDVNGKPLPPREQIGLVFPELSPEYSQKRDQYMAEWFQIFGYTPGS